MARAGLGLCSVGWVRGLCFVVQAPSFFGSVASCLDRGGGGGFHHGGARCSLSPYERGVLIPLERGEGRGGEGLHVRLLRDRSLTPDSWQVSERNVTT